MKEFIINKNDLGQRLDRFIIKAVPRLSKTQLYKYIRIKRIKVNDKKSEINYKLQLNDSVKLYINDEYFDKKEKNDFLFTTKPIDVIYEDSNILLVNKPIGLVVHEDNDNTIDTLINRCLYYLHTNNQYDYKNENSFTPSLCNRIDRNTTGIVIVAKTACALRFINEKIKNRQIKKIYLCVLSGKLKNGSGTLTHYMKKDEQNNKVFVFDKPQNDTKTMILKYNCLKHSNENTLAEVELITGRTHQIRAQFAHIGHPLIGDGKYGFNKINKKYNQTSQVLCSYKLKFEFEPDSDFSEFDYLINKEFSIGNVWFYDEFNLLF